MLVSHRKKFIYTKTVKTAGTSVEVLFEPYCMHEGEWRFSHARDEYASQAGIIGCRGDKLIKVWFHHMPASKIMDLVGRDIWQSYFKFCVIRNPFDKLVSAFHHFKARGLISLEEFPNVTADEEQFKLWISENDGARSVLDRDKYVIDNKICCDYFIRYEELEAGIKHVCDSIGIEFHLAKLMKLKSQFRPQNRSLKNYYDSYTKNIVQEVFNFELNEFQYELP